MGSKVHRRKERREKRRENRADRSKKHQRGIHGSSRDDREAAPEHEDDQVRRYIEPESDRACLKCLRRSECFEQRGRCAEFKTLKQWRKERRQDIERLNNENKKGTSEDGPEDVDKDGAR